MTRAVAILALAAAVALGAAACSPAVTPSPPPPTPSPSPSPTPQTLACEPDLAAAPLEVNAALLEILPEDVDGIPIEPSPEGEAAGLDDDCLAALASSFASGFAADPESFVFAIVARLRDPALDPEVYRDWRDSFDEGACSQASGVQSNAETEIGSRIVHIATCTGGVRTYHVWIEADALLVSASAVGERRLGELLVENLRP